MKNRFAVALVAVLLVAGVALAGTIVSENYAEVKQQDGGVPEFESALSGLTGSDSTTWSQTTPLPGRCFYTRGDGTLEVGVRLSANNATACIVVCRRDRANGLQGVASIQTATALGGTSAVYDGSGYWAEPLYFPLVGWAKYEVRCYDVSGSNTCDLKPAVVGATGEAAE